MFGLVQCHDRQREQQPRLGQQHIGQQRLVRQLPSRQLVESRQRRAEHEREDPILLAQRRRLQQGDGDEPKESAIVQVDERAALGRGHLLVTRKESRQRENNPVRREKSRALPKLRAAASRMHKSPISKSGEGGEETQERHVCPAIANDKHRGRDGERHVGEQCEDRMIAVGVVDERDVRSKIRSGNREHGHHFRLPSRG